MDQDTARRLNDINRRFYEVTAESFDQTRQSPWPGWEALLPYRPPRQTPLSVLDVGCGNGRFGVFLAQRLGIDVHYHGVDNSAVLLERARQSLTSLLADAHLELRDIVENPPDSGEYDLVVLFGVLHHIPGYEQRLDLMRRLSLGVRSGGLLAFACWRFYESKRYRDRIIPWSPDFIDNLKVESNDFLLDWRRDHIAVRY